MSFASAKLNRIQSGCSRRRECVEKNRRAARICCASSNESDVEATLELPAKGKQAVLELRVEVSKPLPAVEGKGRFPRIQERRPGCKATQDARAAREAAGVYLENEEATREPSKGNQAKNQGAKELENKADLD